MLHSHRLWALGSNVRSMATDRMTGAAAIKLHWRRRLRTSQIRIRPLCVAFCVSHFVRRRAQELFAAFNVRGPVTRNLAHLQLMTVSLLKSCCVMRCVYHRTVLAARNVCMVSAAHFLQMAPRSFLSSHCLTHENATHRSDYVGL